ncbi:MFS transporter [Sphaerisporangium sp. B11E5]|uniref:MFS transporter n=1 Tax=Sphaerisporangium sp. B11E5 TaxID=3153563 RepID=UPI00325F34A5
MNAPEPPPDGPGNPAGSGEEAGPGTPGNATGAPPRRRGPAARLGPLADREFRLYWLAVTLSLVGDYTFRVAFITYIITVSGSPATLALATTALLVPPLVFYLVGGVTGDRVRSRKHVLVGADLFRFAALAAMTAAVVTSQSVTVVIALALLIGIGDGFFNPTSFAFLTEIVKKDKLVQANSANSISRQIGVILGPTLGGFLLGWYGPGTTFAFDALTFLLSAALIAMIRHRPAGDGERAARRNVLADATEGLRYVSGLRWLLVVSLTGAVANAVFTGNLDVAVPLILAPEGTGQAQYLGLYYSLQGAGALVGALILTRLTVTRAGPTMMSMLVLMALALAMVGVIGQSPFAYLMAVAYGLGLHFFNSTYPSLLQQQVPGPLLGRVGSVVFLSFHGLMPLGTLLSGPLAAALGPRGAALWTGAAVAVLALLVMRAPSVRTLTLRNDPGPAADRRPEPEPAPGRDQA